MKLKYSVYGNCQAAALAKCLNQIDDFKKKYDYVPLKHVHGIQLSELGLIERNLSELDLIIYQHISDDYKIPQLSTNRILTCVPNSAIEISIPSLYFNAYFPHLNRFGLLKTITGFVHDFNIMAGYVRNIPAQNLADLIENINFYSKEEVHNFLIHSIAELEKRESSNNVDIPISQFINKFYNQGKLFNTHNHPTGLMFSFLVTSILKKLKILYKDNEIESIKQISILDRVSYSIYPSIAYHLNLEFSKDFVNDKVQGVENKKYSYRELVHAFYDVYDSFNNKLKLSQIIEKKKPFVLTKINEFM